MAGKPATDSQSSIVHCPSYIVHCPLSIVHRPFPIIPRSHLVPPHVRHFLLVAFGAEAEHVHGEDSEAVGVALLGVAAHELLPYADSEHGLAQGADNAVEAVGSQVAHGLAGLALSREEHSVCCAQALGLVGHYGLHAKASERVDDGVDVSGVVFYDSYFHNRAQRYKKYIARARLRLHFFRLPREKDDLGQEN